MTVKQIEKELYLITNI